MENQQPVYLFAGGRGKSVLGTFKELGEVIRSTGKPRPEVAVVGVAGFGDNWIFTTLMRVLIKTGCRCRTRRVKIAHRRDNLDKAREILKNADVIFIGGGDAELGMRILREKGMEDFLRGLAKEGKLFIGVSAGTIMLGREWVRWENPNDDTTAELFPCLGLAPVVCDTHAEGDEWVELKTALQLKEEGAEGYGLPSGAYVKAYPDGRLETGTQAVVCYAKTNRQISRKPDLQTGGNG